MTAAASPSARPDELDRVLSALVELLASVFVATREDPSKYRVASTCALAAMVARDVVLRHGLKAQLARAVQVRRPAPSDDAAGLVP